MACPPQGRSRWRFARATATDLTFVLQLVLLAASLSGAGISAPVPATSSISATSAARINPTGRTIVLSVPMRTTAPLGEVEITIATDDTIMVKVDDFAAAVSRLASPQAIAKLRAAADGQGQIALTALAALDFPASYQPDTAEIVLTINASAVNRRTLDLGKDAGRQIRPDTSTPASAFIDYRFGLLSQVIGAGSTAPAVVGDIETAGRIAHRIGFETFASFDSAASAPFLRNASRLIYDLPYDGIRLTAGDLVTATTAFQADDNIAGINISHLRAQLGALTTPPGLSGRSLLIERDSDVQILVNGLVIGEVHLSPGNYDLRNLPITQGVNNFEVVVTDNTGQRRSYHFSLVDSAQLLAQGQSEFTLSAGVLAPMSTAGPAYSGQPALQGYYNRGISQSLTMGANIEATRQMQLAGISAIWGAHAGLVSADLAASHDYGNVSGAALRLQYSYVRPAAKQGQSANLDVYLEYDTAHFAIPSAEGTIVPDLAIPVSDGNAFDLATYNAHKLSASINASVPLSQSLSLRLAASYGFQRSGGNTGQLSAQVMFRGPMSSTIGLGMSYTVAPLATSETSSTSAAPTEPQVAHGLSALLTLTKRFGTGMELTASGDRFNQQLSFSRTPARPIDDWYVNANTIRDVTSLPGTASGTVTAGYQTNRGDIELTSTSNMSSSGALSSEQFSAAMTGSIAYADGALGVGPRIDDAFAIFTRDPSIYGHQLSILDSYGKSPRASSGLLGPPVLPLGAYADTVVTFSIANMPAGYDLGSGSAQVYPWAHAGYRIRVGSPDNISAFGTLVDGDGAPVALRSGAALSLAHPEKPAVVLITNDQGHFALSGVAPGVYLVEMTGTTRLIYRISVTRAADMLVMLGTLHPETPK